MGSCRGIFPSAQRCSRPGYLQQVLPPFFHSFTPAHLAMCFKCKFLVCAQACMHGVFALGSYNVYGQISTRFPGFQAKPSPHSVTSDTWVPAHFELIQDEAMQNLGRLAVSRHQPERGQALPLSLSLCPFLSVSLSLLLSVFRSDGQGKMHCLADRVSWIGTLSSLPSLPNGQHFGPHRERKTERAQERESVIESGSGGDDATLPACHMPQSTPSQTRTAAVL